MFSKIRYFVMVFFTLIGNLFEGDFVGFYLSYGTDGSEFFNPIFCHCVVSGVGGVSYFLRVCSCLIFE